LPPPPELLSPVDAEINILRAVKTCLIDPGITPHIVEILAAYICPRVAALIKDKKQCKRLVEGEEPIDDTPQSLLCILQELIARGHSLDRVALVFMEECQISLPEFMEHHLPATVSARDELLTTFVFQVYYTLLALTRTWSNFAHGDLTNLANLMIKFTGDSLPEWSVNGGYFLRYIVPGAGAGTRTFDIPYHGLIIKLIDFGHSKIPEEKIVSAVEQNRPERANEFIPDYIEFIYTFERQFVDLGLPTQSLKSLFETLNPRGIKKEMALRVQIDLAGKSPALEESMTVSAFDTFLTKDDHENRILQTYRARDSKK
jgi:serine/threonine protein kinase